ncbi:MAG: hypothetical protein HQL26_10660 [Candidatus Omnitrophica bacterium]|nr:hypothetical protein [Candidatus Omnitrophota bacterium]
MPLSLYYYTSFDRSLNGLDYEQKKIVQRILLALETYYNSNCDLSAARKFETRFFYKKLRKPYYEAGIEGKLRVIIERDKADCILVLAGNHDQIRKFLNK